MAALAGDLTRSRRTHSGHRVGTRQAVYKVQIQSWGS